MTDKIALQGVNDDVMLVVAQPSSGEFIFIRADKVVELVKQSGKTLAVRSPQEADPEQKRKARSAAFGVWKPKEGILKIGYGRDGESVQGKDGIVKNVEFTIDAKLFEAASTVLRAHVEDLKAVQAVYRKPKMLDEGPAGFDL